MGNSSALCKVQGWPPGRPVVAAATPAMNEKAKALTRMQDPETASRRLRTPDSQPAFASLMGSGRATA